MKKIAISVLVAALGVVLSQSVLAQQTRQPRSSLLNRNSLRNRQTQTPRATPAANPSAESQEESAETPKGEAPAFNWDAAPADMVLQAYGERVGKTVLKDPQVPAATITLKSKPGQKLTNEEWLEAIETILEMNQIHLEPYGDSFIRALPRKDVRKEGIPLYMDIESMEIDVKAGKITDGKVISLMIQFDNIAIEEAQKALEGFKSNSGILLVFERTNSILVTDTKQNIDKMMEIAKKIDIASPVTEVVEYIQIKYASANDIKTVIDSIVQESMKEQEKNGKVPQTQNQSNPSRPLLGGLRRPGQQNQQPQAPVNNQSLVLSVSDADRGMIRGKVVTIADERSNKILLITSASNMKFFKDVIAALDVETTPDIVVKVYRLKYAEAEDVSDMINDLIGNSVSSKGSNKNNQNQNAARGTSGSVTRGNQTQMKKSVNQRSGEAKAGELNKDNTTVLADKRINGIVVMTNKDLVPTIEQIIESMDIKLSQVLIETVIIEVSLGDGLETGMDWVQKGRQTQMSDYRLPLRDQYGNQKYWDIDPATGLLNGKTTLSPTAITSEGTEIQLEKASAYAEQIVRKGVMNNYVGSTSVGLGGGASGGAAAFSQAAAAAGGAVTNVFGKGFSFIFDSDELGISAILQAQKNDSRSKYVASPIVMTLDNKEAIVNATRMKYLLKGFTSTGNSYSTIAVPDYEQKELGIEIKVTPKINPNGTVMLTVEEKYTQVGADQTIQYAASNGTGEGSGALQPVAVPTTITREMSADVLLESNQTVVFGGLTETLTSESETGIPILKDIPIVGKWLFGSVKQSEDRVELLVFMTPYVLDDADAAQVEALRRKKTMSDPSPWEDHGWSLSPIADPVSRKEQMRRIKDEWRKQDEERRTKIAIEKMKIDRTKKLESMSKDERDMWLKMHQSELDEEQQQELEDLMLDKNSQDKLRELAREVRAKKLKAADKTIDEAEKEMRQDNERDRHDHEKRESTEADAPAPTAVEPVPAPAEEPPPAVVQPEEPILGFSGTNRRI